MISAPETLDDVLFEFHQVADPISPELLNVWTGRYPQFADEIRAHAVEIMDMELLASTQAAPSAQSLVSESITLRAALQEAGTSLRDFETGGETLVELLIALSEHAGRTRHNWRRRRQREGHAVVDRGGGANLWREHAGGPLWGLVNDTLEIYETFKPGRASGHVEPGPRSQEDGTYRAFVRAVFEYATGNVAAEGGALDRWIKKLAGVRRELGQLERRRDVLDTEWHAVNSSQSPNQDQLAAIEAEEAAVREKIADLRRRMFPHLYRA